MERKFFTKEWPLAAAPIQWRYVERLANGKRMEISFVATPPAIIVEQGES